MLLCNAMSWIIFFVAFVRPSELSSFISRLFVPFRYLSSPRPIPLMSLLFRLVVASHLFVSSTINRVNALIQIRVDIPPTSRNNGRVWNAFLDKFRIFVRSRLTNESRSTRERKSEQISIVTLLSRAATLVLFCLAQPDEERHSVWIERRDAEIEMRTVYIKSLRRVMFLLSDIVTITVLCAWKLHASELSAN